MNRVIIKYKKFSKNDFIHGKRNGLPSTIIPFDIKNEIVSLYINEHSGTDFSHFCEIISEDFNINISNTTLSTWLWEENVVPPKTRRKTKKKLKKKLK